ncbi:hypothetical protein ZIOFF_074008 [Zingiber officinale]|uniref:Dof zinc finger protein n=3 Tax=Zingiber officinale TaxID=94328 RepID=A0A8J5C7Z7_ZINOF|nr:hypothetical protein ZIOFF_074008 [Zingiber officinale]
MAGGGEDKRGRAAAPLEQTQNCSRKGRIRPTTWSSESRVSALRAPGQDRSVIWLGERPSRCEFGRGKESGSLFCETARGIVDSGVSECYWTPSSNLSVRSYTNVASGSAPSNSLSLSTVAGRCAVVATILLLSLSLTPISATSPRDSSPLSATFSHYLYAPFPSLPTAPTVLRWQRKGLEKGRGRMGRDGGERLSMCSSSPSSPGKKWPQMKDALLVAPANNYKGTTATATLSSDTHYNNNNKVRDQSMVEKASPAMAKVEALRCPRCDSANTKFCYYNNYSLAQPRHFCKACKRYWTRGGTLRNVPVGGGCRKNKRVVKKPAAAAVGNPSRPLISPPPDRHRIIHTNSLPADAGRPGAAAAALYAHHALQQMASAASLPLVFDGLADPSYDLLPHLGLGVLSSNQDLGFQHLPPVNSILSDDNLLIGPSMLPSPSLFPSSIKHPMKQLEDQFDQSLLPFDTSADQLEASALTNGGINGMMKEVKLESSQSNNMMTGNSFSQNWQNSIAPSHVNPLDNFLPTPSVSMYWNSTTAAAGGGISWSDFNTNCSSSIAPLI